MRSFDLYRFHAAALFMVAALSIPLDPAIAGNGDPSDGYPNWHERAVLALLNAVRQGPTRYRDDYLPADPAILQPNIYPARPPLYFCLALNHAARFHSEDMATNGCFQHNSCNGTPWSTRVVSFYSEGPSGEMIGGGYTRPIDVVNAWVSDGHAPDGAGDPHRAMIMSATHREQGCGYVYSAPSTWHHYWTQEFGRGAVDYATPLAWGSHFFAGDGYVTFLANYHASDNLSPQEALLYVDDVPYAMAPDFGTPARGTHRKVLPLGTDCRTYYFRFRDAAGAYWNFPEAGRLRTYGEGSCTEDYVDMPLAVEPAMPSGPAFVLEPPVPNPAGPHTVFSFTVPAGSDVTLRILDLGGRAVREVAMWVPAGRGSWTWDCTDAGGRGVPGGVYFVQLRSGAWRASQRMVVLGRG